MCSHRRRAGPVKDPLVLVNRSETNRQISRANTARRIDRIANSRRYRNHRGLTHAHRKFSALHKLEVELRDIGHPEWRVFIQIALAYLAVDE